MEIKVLGQGCANCKTLEERVRQAVLELNMDAEIIIVDDIMEIVQHGVMRTPALVIDGKVLVKGFVPTMTEIKGLFTIKK